MGHVCFLRRYFFLLENAYIWKDTNDSRRKPMKARLFFILKALVPLSFSILAPAHPAPEINLYGGEK
jgi:hypothetical protein